MQPDSMKASALRHLLSGLGAILVAHGVSQSKAELLTGIAVFLAPLIWSKVAKTKVGLYITTALQLEAGTSRPELEEAVQLLQSSGIASGRDAALIRQTLADLGKKTAVVLLVLLLPTLTAQTSAQATAQVTAQPTAQATAIPHAQRFPISSFAAPRKATGSSQRAGHL
jgi:hypothetical protein